MRRLSFIKYFSFVLVLLFFQFSGFCQKVVPKKLIQFGWDYPTVSFIKENLNRMESRPFDGVAFSFDFRIYDLFDTVVYPINNFQLEDLRNIRWKKFTDNFIRVRAQSLNGANWLNDQAWHNIEINVRNISKALTMARAKGIFFDPEYYYHDTPDKNPWVYTSKLYPGLSYEEVGQFVKKRGNQFVRALQDDKDDPVIFALWMLSLVTLQAREAPIEKTGMALYPFFIEGILEGKNKNTLIIDGNELGYGYRSEFQFIFSGEELRDWGVALMPADLKPDYEKISISQPIFFDLLFATFPEYDKGYTRAQKENWLEFNLYHAFKSSDQYVWFYNQKIDWWRSENIGIESLLRQTIGKLNQEYNKKNRTTGSSAVQSFLTREQIAESYFEYNFNRRKRRFVINLRSDEVTDLYIFQNSRLLKHQINPPKSVSYKLKASELPGNLILVAKSKKNVYAVAYIN